MLFFVDFFNIGVKLVSTYVEEIFKIETNIAISILHEQSWCKIKTDA